MKNSCRLLNALILFGDFWTVREGSLWSLFFWDNCIPTPNLGKRTVALTSHIFSQLQVASPQKSNFGFARLLEEAFLTRLSCQFGWKHWLNAVYQLFFPPEPTKDSRFCFHNNDNRLLGEKSFPSTRRFNSVSSPKKNSQTSRGKSKFGN